MRSVRRRSNEERGELTFSCDMKTKIKSGGGESRKYKGETLFGNVFSQKIPPFNEFITFMFID